MTLSNEFINKIYRDAMNENQLHNVQKAQFQCYLSGLKNKLIILKTKEAQEQLQIVEWMDRFLESQTYVNVISSIQSKMIHELERQILKLELDKQDLLTENENLKANI